MDELVRLEVELARRQLLLYHASYSGNSEGLGGGCSWGIRTDGNHDGVEQWTNLPQRILAASPHFQGGDIPWDVVQELRDQGMGLVEALDLLGL